MKKQELKEKITLPKECDPDQQIHPCGSRTFCPEDPEKCIFYKNGLR